VGAPVYLKGTDTQCTVLRGPRGGYYQLDCGVGSSWSLASDADLQEDSATQQAVAETYRHMEVLSSGPAYSDPVSPEDETPAAPDPDALPQGQWQTLEWHEAGNDYTAMQFELLTTWTRVTLVGKLSVPAIVDVQVVRYWPVHSQPVDCPPDDCDIERVEHHYNPDNLGWHQSGSAWAVTVQPHLVRVYSGTSRPPLPH